LNLVEGEMNEYLGGYFDDIANILFIRTRPLTVVLGRVSLIFDPSERTSSPSGPPSRDQLTTFQPLVGRYAAAWATLLAKRLRNPVAVAMDKSLGYESAPLNAGLESGQRVLSTI